MDAPGQDPSAAQVSALIKAIKDKGIKAIFAEAQFNDDLVRTIADETGATVVSDLYTDTVGDARQDTYAGMMAWNIEQVASGARGQLTLGSAGGCRTYHPDRRTIGRAPAETFGCCAASGGVSHHAGDTMVPLPRPLDPAGPTPRPAEGGPCA